MNNHIYAIGDVQGCYQSLMRLLEKINFDPAGDQLWFTGDLVNRGPESLETLRFIKSLGDNAVSVLGNHDLFLLTIYHGYHAPRANDTLDAVLAANDYDELAQWLLTLPLLHTEHNYVMTHAGIPPQWNLPQAQQLAADVQQQMQTDSDNFFKHLYGNKPSSWSDSLQGFKRTRYIVNAFTRMRFCHANGELDLHYSGPVATYHGDAKPWFAWPNRKTKNQNIIFGHWAALHGKTNTERVFALDTGCSWGETLTAMRLSDQQVFTVPCV
jgi:bis(5'-nucleosyl)-tetraphosphatase (symmetrical)